jgi:AraC-like DNA-binding protein
MVRRDKAFDEVHNNATGAGIGLPERPITINEFVNRCQCHLGTILSSNKEVSIHASCKLLDAVPLATSHSMELALVNALKQILKAYAWRYSAHVDPSTLLAIATSTTVSSTIRELRVYLHEVATQDDPLAAREFHPIVRRALHFVELHYHDSTLDLASVAGGVGVSRWHLSRMLRQTTGRSFLEHLHDLRLREAIRLLRATDKSIKEIAYQVGYSRTTQLDNHFQRTFGATPSEFRAHHTSRGYNRGD